MLLLITYLLLQKLILNLLLDEEGNENGEFAIVSADEPFKALAFKIMDDRFGALTFVRIYSGKLEQG